MAGHGRSKRDDDKKKGMGRMDGKKGEVEIHFGSWEVCPS